MILNRVEAVAKEKKKTVRQISDETGIRYNTILNIFRGQGTRIDLDTINALCRVLQVQPGDLFQWIPDQQEEELSEGEARSYT